MTNSESINEMIRATRGKTRDLLRQAETYYELKLPGVDVKFDLRGQSAGQARIARHGPALIRYNPTLLVENGEDFIATTVPHEVAHVIAYLHFGPRIRPHGPEWRSVMAFFGADSSRCHGYDTGRARLRRLSRYLYRCDCREHQLTSIRHNRILRGQRYHCRICGSELKSDVG